MNTDHVICPHCGCRCEDDEFCAACGRLFHEDDDVEALKFSLIGILANGLRSLFRQAEEDDCNDEKSHLLTPEFLLEQADPETDPSWSSLSTNIYNEDRM